MRILDVDSDKSISEILLMLTVDEAERLKAGLAMLLTVTDTGAHDHVSESDEHKTVREITIAIYDEIPNSPYYFKQFNQRTQKLILEDK